MKKILLLVLLVITILWGFIAWKIFKPMPILTEKTDIQEKSEIWQWQKISDEKIIDSNGKQMSTFFRQWKENNLLIYFLWGGVSLDEYTDAKIWADGKKEFFNSESDDFWAGIFVNILNISSYNEKNPFKDWSVLVIPYASGDFHIWSGKVEYTAEDWSQKILYHNGYNNFDTTMNIVKNHISNPDKIVISGSSAGGFGVSQLTNDIVSRFPNTENITSMIDASLLLNKNWYEIAKNKWQSPEKILQNLQTDNFVLDGIKSISKENPHIKILFATTTRDYMLGQYQNYIDNKKHEATLESTDNIEKITKQMIKDISEIPNTSVYIANRIQEQEIKGEFHTFLMFFGLEKFENPESVMEWMYSAANWKMTNYGLDLIQ